MAYRAEIEIAVKGSSQLTNLTKQLETASATVNRINKELATKGLFTGSIENLRRVSATAERTMRSAAAGTYSQKQAIDVYVRSLDAAEKAELKLAAAIKKRQRELGLTPQGGGPSGFLKGRVGGAVTGSAIGLAFPLLFGQGAGAAVGGGIGGLVGGLTGIPGGSFAGSLIGTLLGDVASEGAKVKELAADIGLSAKQTEELAKAFKLAGEDFDKFQASVQNIRGLSLSIEDQATAIQLVSTLTEKYNGKIDKVTNAFTSALEQGKVTQATLNQLTSEGIPIQQALADKYKVSRSTILQMAKDGKISVQELSDTLVELANNGVAAATKPLSPFAQFQRALGVTGDAVGTLAGKITTVLGAALDAILIKATQVLNSINAALAAGQLSPELKQGFQATAESVVKSQAGFLPGGPFGTGKITVKYGGKTYTGFASSVTADITNDQINTYVQNTQKVLAGPQKPLNKITVPSQLPPSGGGGGGKSEAEKAAEAAAREAARVAELVRDRQLNTLELQRSAVFSREIFQAELAKDPILVRQRQGQEELVKLGIETARQLEKEKNGQAQLEIAREANAKKALILQKIEEDTNRIINERQEKFSNTIRDLQAELDIKNATTKAEKERLRIELERKKLIEGGEFDSDQIDAIIQLQTAIAAPVAGVALIRQEVGKLSDELIALVDIGNQVTQAADAISTSFANSFKGLISGSTTAKEALASFFQGVADYFLDMAAQIIKKWLQMIILNQVLRLFPGGNIAAAGTASGTAAFGASGPTFNPIAFTPGLKLNANGNAYARNGIVPFAYGGVVNSPTLFKFANGGSMRTGIMGEAGPEAILPLSRGANGRLGVEAAGNMGATNIVVNVDAKGTSVQGNDANGNQLGRVISAAVQQELIKQKRPGGLLA